jgi:hypothetical protein
MSFFDWPSPKRFEKLLRLSKCKSIHSKHIIPDNVGPPTQWVPRRQHWAKHMRQNKAANGNMLWNIVRNMLWNLKNKLKTH